MKRLLVLSLFLALFTGPSAHAQTGQPCAASRVGGKLEWLAACDLPEDGSYLKCDSTSGGGKVCYLYEGPVDSVKDENGDGLEASNDNITEIWASSSIIYTRGTGSVAITGVRASWDPAIIDDSYLSGKGACTSQNGCTLNDPIVIGAGGKFEDGSARQMTTGHCFPVKLESYEHNVGVIQYYSWFGGATTGSNAAAQDAAEMNGLNCPGGFATIGYVPFIGTTQTAIPASATLGLGVTINNADGASICSFTSADTAAGTTCTPSNRNVTTSDASGLWLQCSGTCTDASSYDLHLMVCCR